MSTFSGGPNIVTDGLVLYLDAANNQSYPRSGTRWNDLSKNSNFGTLTNGPTFNSANGGSIVLDGVNDSVELSNSNSYKPPFPLSLCVWYKVNSLPSVIFVLLKTDNPTNGWHSGITFNLDNSFRFSIDCGNNTANDVVGRRSYRSNVGAYSINRWNYGCVVLPDNLNCMGYSNGINVNMVYTTGTANTLVYSGNPMSIGYRYDAGAARWFLNGNVSQVQIYNRALSQQEILQNYNATKSRFGL